MQPSARHNPAVEGTACKLRLQVPRRLRRWAATHLERYVAHAARAPNRGVSRHLDRRNSNGTAGICQFGRTALC